MSIRHPRRDGDSLWVDEAKTLFLHLSLPGKHLGFLNFISKIVVQMETN